MNETNKSDEVQHHERIAELADQTRTVWTDPDELPLFGEVAGFLNIETDELAMVLDRNTLDSLPFAYFAVYDTDGSTWTAFLDRNEDGKLSFAFPPRERPGFWNEVQETIESAVLLSQLEQDDAA